MNTKFWQFQNNTIFVISEQQSLIKTINCGVRKQRQENGKRLQQTHQSREKKNLFF